MTIGSAIEDDRYSTSIYGIIHGPYGSALTGAYYSKSWSGSDNPVTKPTYKKFYFSFGGAQYTVKQRVDIPQRRQKGADHPYACTIRMFRDNQFSRYSSLTGDTTYTTFLYDFGPGDGENVNPTSTWNANDDLALIGKLREAIAGSDFNLGIFLGESHQSVKLIAESATRIYQFFHSLKRGDLVGIGRSLKIATPKAIPKGFAQGVLEFRYGWQPLLKDVQSAAEFLAKRNEYPYVATYKVKMKKPFAFLAQTQDWGSRTVRGQTRVQYIARLSEVNPVLLSGLVDVESVAWELTPWSFVADWFIPIGSYLAARGLARSLTGTFVKTKTVTNYWEIDGHNNSGFTTYLSSPHYNGFNIQVDRTVSTTLSVPLPTFKTPFGRNRDGSTSWVHAQNAIALLVSSWGTGRSPGRGY